MISGTEILVSGFLSNIRVIKSFKKSVTSGLGKGEGRHEVGKGMDEALVTCVPRCHAALPFPNPPGNQNIPFLGNPEHDIACIRLGEPDTNSTQAKTQKAATAEVNLFPQMPLQLLSLLLWQLQSQRCCFHVQCNGSFPRPRANRRARSPSFADLHRSRASPTQAVSEKQLK